MKWQLITVSVGVQGQFPVWAREVNEDVEIRGLSATPFETLYTKVPRGEEPLEAQVAQICCVWFKVENAR
jgi:hypothetical protein